MKRFTLSGRFAQTVAARGVAFAALAVAARSDVEMSFAGRLEIDSPVRLALAAKGALAPWRTMTTSGMTEREDGTREFAMAAEGAPRIKGEFRAWNDAAGGRNLQVRLCGWNVRFVDLDRAHQDWIIREAEGSGT